MSWQDENAPTLGLSYEEVPYDGLTHSETHPSLLAAGSLCREHRSPFPAARALRA